MTIEGKGMFTWKLPRCENGDAAALAAVAKSAHLSHVLVKIADGSLQYNGDWGISSDYVPAAVNALHAQGIQAWGWHFVYGDDPAGEARIAIRRITQLQVDAYVIDAEGQYSKTTKKEAARRFMAELRAALPNFPIALSSYRYPTLHPQLPWKEFLEKCDYNMPQMYWMQAHNPGAQLARCLREFQAMTPFRTIIPTGAAFREHGWQPTAGEILEFLKKAKDANLPAVNFWEWAEARSGVIQGGWETIRDFSWIGEPLPLDICQELVEALQLHDANKLASFYTPTAVHVTSTRTIQGSEAIKQWYTSVFNRILPNATFTLTGFSGTGSTRHFTWTADSNIAVVQNGNDTLGLVNGKIAYHYQFFTAKPL
jgi:hypothetical protein